MPPGVVCIKGGLYLGWEAEQTPPGLGKVEQTPLELGKWAVHILLECLLVLTLGFCLEILEFLVTRDT